MQDKDRTIANLMWKLIAAMDEISRLKKEIAELKKRKEKVYETDRLVRTDI